jgi:solute carrier family 25 carnitine/acylcarnitine transporter 20/29
MSLRSLYRGWSVTILRDLGYGPYFFVYEYVVRGGGVFGAPKRDLKEEIDEELWGHGLRDDDEGGSKAQGEGGASTARILLAGGLAGIVGWGCT